MAYLWLHPHYRFLLGPVSLSSDYQPISRFLIVRYLENHFYDAAYAALLRPLNPFQEKKAYRSFTAAMQVIRDEAELASILSEAESRESRVPILLKHYLRLGGKVFAFKVDPLFNDALDGLIALDLLQMPREHLEKLMMAEKAQDYLNFQQNLLQKLKKILLLNGEKSSFLRNDDFLISIIYEKSVCFAILQYEFSHFRQNLPLDETLNRSGAKLGIKALPAEKIIN